MDVRHVLGPFFFVNLISEQLIVILFWKQCLWPSVYGFLIEYTYLLSDVLAILHSSIFCTWTWIFSCDLSIRQWSVTYSQSFRWAWIQPECCFDLLQGSCPFSFSPFLFCGFVSSLNPSSEILSLAPAKGLRLQWLVPVEAGPSRLTYTHSRDICCVYGFVGDLHPSKRNLIT